MAVISGETIWVTGASTGIGRALAIALAQQGNTVVASARNGRQLDELAQQYDSIVPLVFDVTDEHSIDAARRQLQSINPYLDRVVVNAGTCEYLDIATPDWDMMRRVMTVNYFGTVNTLALAMPLLQARPGGGAHIVGVVSLATVAPFPRAEAYGASKAAMQYFLDSLRLDLSNDAIDVTVINPGFVATPLTDKNDFEMPFLVSAEAAASRIVTAIARRSRQYDFPRRLLWSLKLFGFFPGVWNKLMAPKPQ